MSKYSILHITDAHFGQSGMSGRWPTIKAQFFEDLRHVITLNGPIHLVAFTGDIANRGLAEEYALAESFMDELGNFFVEFSDVIPTFVAVPGNHDVARPSGISLARSALESGWNVDHEKMLFEAIDANDLQKFSRELFRNYADWENGPGHALTPIHVTNRGVLPGDFVATDIVDGLKIGIIGINSTFRHLSDAAKPGHLSIPAQQVQRAAGGDLPKWSLQHDVSLLLTHHPISWMQNRADTEDALFNAASTTRLHLCGHLHLEEYSSHAPGTSATRLTHQGQSLFGLEQFAGSDRPEDRQHGYAVVSIEREGELLSTTIWPRRGERRNDGTWTIDRHAGFGLDKNENRSKPFVLTPATRTISAKSSIPAVPASMVSDSGESSTNFSERFLKEFARGFMVAVIGDRFVERGADRELAFGCFRQSAWNLLDTGEVDDPAVAIDQLLQLAAEDSSAKLKVLVAESLGNPPQAAVLELNNIVKSPWAGVIYLSPLADLEACVSISPSAGSSVIIDGTTAPYRLPAPDQRVVLRLAGPAPSDGSLELRLDEVLARSQEKSPGDWRRYAKQLLSRSPSVFITDSVTSLSLWQWIADRNSSAEEFRLPAFLVCPNVPRHLRPLLLRYDVCWIEASVADFTSRFLVSSRAEYGSAKTALANRRRRLSRQTPLAIGALRASSMPGSRDYLLGSNPNWNDITTGYAARLSSQLRIMEGIKSVPERSMVLVSGTAGSGRTTSLMQCALDLEAAHKSVAWIDPAVSKEKISQIIDQVIDEKYDYVFVDDVDAFGAQAERLLQGLKGGEVSKRIVVAGTRSVRTFLVDGLTFTRKVEVGNLASEDVEKVIAVLRKNRAIASKRQSDRELRDLLMSSNGQLIVGMIQATSGVPFVQKISSECSQLSVPALLMYGAAAIVTAENESIAVAQLQDAVGGDENASWQVLKSLEKSRLLQIKPNTERYEVRHRVIAEEVRNHLSKVGALATVVGGTLRAFAAAAAQTSDRSYHGRRILIRLLNHSYLIKTLGLSQSKIREIYDSVEDILEDDFHYWLQRGAFEVEIGDLTNAMHDLKSASTTVGGEDDHKVLTEFAVLRLKIAANSRNSDAIALSIAAIEDLHKVLRVQGTNSPHTFTTLAAAGVPWLAGAVISRTEKRDYAEKSLSLLKAAGSLMRTNQEVAQKLPPAIKTLEDLLATL